MDFRGHDKTMALLTITQRITDAASDIPLRNERIAMAWNMGASAQELHDASGLSGDELKAVLIEHGADPRRRRKGWIGLRSLRARKTRR